MKPKHLSTYRIKMGNRRVYVSLYDDGYYHITWVKKAGYRTKKETSVKLTSEAMHATILCAIACNNGWKNNHETQN